MVYCKRKRYIFMLTSNQKRELRSMANRINAVFQVGKDGVNSNMITDVLNYLNKHELMKVSILQNCPQTKEEVADAFANSDIEVVQIIGKTVVLYKQSENAKNPIILKSDASDLLYVEFDEENDRFILKQVPLKKSDLQFIPVELQYFTMGDIEEISVATYSELNGLVYGTNSGALFQNGLYPSSETIDITLTRVTEPAHHRISDIIFVDTNYYFITNNNNFKLWSKRINILM